MENRPIIKLKLTLIDWIAELISLLLVVLCWVVIFISYSQLPETIASHFDSFGKANGFSSKESIIALPIITTFLFIGLSVLNKYPHSFNIPVVITETNAFKQYTYATRLVRFLKLSLTTTFFILINSIINSAKKETMDISPWLLPLVLCLVFTPIIVYFIISRRNN